MITTYQFSTNESIEQRSEVIATKAIDKLGAYFHQKKMIKKNKINIGDINPKK